MPVSLPTAGHHSSIPTGLGEYLSEAAGMAAAPPTLILQKQAGAKVFICTHCPLKSKTGTWQSDKEAFPSLRWKASARSVSSLCVSFSFLLMD